MTGAPHCGSRPPWHLLDPHAPSSAPAGTPRAHVQTASPSAEQEAAAMKHDASLTGVRAITCAPTAMPNTLAVSADTQGKPHSIHPEAFYQPCKLSAAEVHAVQPSAAARMSRLGHAAAQACLAGEQYHTGQICQCSTASLPYKAICRAHLIWCPRGRQGL